MYLLNHEGEELQNLACSLTNKIFCLGVRRCIHGPAAFNKWQSTKHIPQNQILDLRNSSQPSWVCGLWRSQVII